MSWYLESITDASPPHAHRAQRNPNGTVTALCGLTFRPQPRLFDKEPAYATPPRDPLQSCPTCQAADENTDTDGAAVMGLIQTLSSPRPTIEEGDP